MPSLRAPLCALLSGAIAASASASANDVSLASRDGVATWTLSSRAAGAADAHIGAVHVAARVPGDVHDDLERAGLLPDLWVADNSTSQPWHCTSAPARAGLLQHA